MSFDIMVSFISEPKVPFPWIIVSVILSKLAVRAAAFLLVMLSVFKRSSVRMRFWERISSPGSTEGSLPLPGRMLIIMLPTNPSELMVAIASFFIWGKIVLSIIMSTRMVVSLIISIPRTVPTLIPE